MSYYGGLGPMVNGVLWTEAVLFALFVTLRLYTRKQILNAVGADDYICILALVRRELRLFIKSPLTDSPRSSTFFTQSSSL
jgi:hypothetical protein